MVKHIVMWRYENKNNVTEAKRHLLSMKGRVSSMLDIEVGENFNQSDAAYDLVLITTHKDRQTLIDYQEDPIHTGVKQALGGLKSIRTVVDFEV